jgi:hypothetical protein
MKNIIPAIEKIRNNWLVLNEKEETCHYLLRSQFMVTESPENTSIAITAGSVYHLYINGEVVMTGPARAISRYFFVDTIDISKWIKKGENTIAIRVAYYPNSVPENIQYEFPQHSPGIGLCLWHGNKQLTLADKWKITSLEAFEKNTIWSRGLKGEFVYARKFPNEWYPAGFDDSNWTVVHASKLQKAPVELRERAIPLPFLNHKIPQNVIDFGFYELQEQFKNRPIPEKMLAWFGAKEKYDYKSDKPVAIAPNQLDRVKFRQLGNAISGGEFVLYPSSILKNGNGGLILKGTKEKSSYVVYDLGENTTGSPYIEAEIPEGVRIDINLMEWLDNEWGAPSDNHQRLFNPMVSHGGLTLIGDGRGIHYTSMQKHNFRYICIVARDMNKEQLVTVKKLGLIEHGVIHPADTKADVTCSDPVLNQIVDACKRTLRINAHDGYVDCTCERIVTSGDCFQSSEGGRLFYGETGRQISENMFHLFVDQGMGDEDKYPDMPNGRCSAITLAEGENMLWMLASCMVAYDMVQWAKENNTPLPEKFKQTVTGVARNVSDNLNEEGLIPHDGKMSNWSDWSKMAVSGEDGSVNMSVNAYFYRLFRESAEVIPGEPIFAEVADKIQTGLQKLCAPSILTHNERVFRFVPDMFVRKDGKLVPFRVEEAHVFGTQQRIISETTQYWLLWSGVLPKEQEQLLWDVLRGWNSFELPVRDNTRMLNPSRSSSVMGLCPRFRYMAEIKDSKLYNDVRETFGPNVLRDKTLWESLELDTRSSAHATTAYAGIVLYQCLTGIIPGDKPGKVRIEPLIDHTLEWARGYKETEKGTIGVSWRRGEQKFTLRVTLPGGVSAIIKLPEPVVGFLIANAHEIKNHGIYAVNNSVEITADRFSGIKMRDID